MDEDVSTERWAVELKGTESDLRYWRAELKPEFEPFVVDHKNGDQTLVALESQRFLGVNSATGLMAIADDLISELNGVFFTEGNPTVIDTGRAIKIKPDGSINFHTLVRLGVGEVHVPKARVHAVGQVIDKDGNIVVQLPEPSFAQKAIETGRNNQLLKDASSELSPTSDIHSLYRVYEMLAADPATKQLRSSAKRKRFSGSANTNGTRHRPKPDEIMENPMGTTEARVFIRDWLYDALRL